MFTDLVPLDLMVELEQYSPSDEERVEIVVIGVGVGFHIGVGVGVAVYVLLKYKSNFAIYIYKSFYEPPIQSLKL